MLTRARFSLLLAVLISPQTSARGWVNRCVNGSGCDLPLIG